MRTLIMIAAFCSGLLAAQTNDIDAMIDEIVNAPQAQRYEKMNAFKQKMRALNGEQRREALKALQAKMQGSGGPVTAASDAETERTETTVKLQQMQMQQQKQQQMQMQQQRIQQQQVQQLMQQQQQMQQKAQ